VRPVTVGVTEGIVSAIDKGLAAGDQVVTDGQDRLKAGIRVDAHLEGAGGADATAQADAASDSGAPRQRKNQGGAQSGAPGSASAGSDPAPRNGGGQAQQYRQGGQNGQAGDQPQYKNKKKNGNGAPIS